MKKLQKNRKGITLIELLITLSILAIFIQIIYSIFFVSNKSFNMGKNKGFAQQDARIVSEFITKELRTAKEIGLDQISLSGKYYSLEIDGGKLIKKTYEAGATKNESTLFTGSLKEIRFERFEGDFSGLIKVYISTKEKDQGYELNFNILLENLPDYEKLFQQNIIYYSKYEE